MSRLSEIEYERRGMGTISELTGAFEGIASMRISRIKNQVLQSMEFFTDLWNIYTQLRVDGTFRYGRGAEGQKEVIDKDLYIIITAEGGFSGDIDQKLIRVMLENYDPNKQDIIVIGHHGAVQLAQKGIAYKKYFKMPQKDQNINVNPVISYIQQYRKTIVYYQQYVSLMVQDVRRIELSKAVAEIGDKVEEGEEIISEANCIFEPSTYTVISYIERSMLQIAVSQLILDSKLAQYASRFRAMSASHQAADDSLSIVNLRYNRTKRSIKDERLKETLNGLKKAKAEAA